MRRNRAVQKFLAVFFVFLALPILASAQAANIQARITQPVDDTILAVLKGNTHPLARAEFDHGAAPAGMPLHRMLLSLKRSPAQESALQQLLIDLQDKSSLNYHKWLTPAQFGQQFGASDEDIQAITSWLGSHGFQVANVSSGRTVIEFSGTVGQVQQAFHTAIHKYVVNGEEHWANSSNPQIPTALVPVVAGVSTLHNFVKHPHYKTSGARLAGTSTGGPRPAVNLQGCTINANPCPAKDQFIFHALGPGDFATIYNTPTSLNIKAPAQQFNGDGVTIAIIARSNINVTDVQEFRAIFGVSPANLNIILNGPDPGNLGGGEEFEAVLDATWSGSVAPNAAVDFVVSESTETTDGVDLSEVFIIDNNLAPVMSESFGQCEQDAGSAQATNESNLAEQAAAQGITFMASTGDTGAEGCDDPHSEITAKGPIAVGIPAALPFTVAVGGTMLTQNDAAFWNANNSNTFESANSYIPEDVWNESCATQSSCLASVTSGGGGPNILAGSGGASIFFTKPAFQSGVAGLSGPNREVPDVSLNAAVFHDPAVLCVDDQLPPGNTGCADPGNFFILTVGGTSVASPSFAGVMALVNQATGQRQGEAGFVLYKLAANEGGSPGLSACNASAGNGPTGTTCVFNDVTSGNNAVPGETGFGTAGADFQAGIGYDEASGLGSVNVTNLINMWNTARVNGSTTTLAQITPAPPSTIPHGTSATVSITVAASQNGKGTPTGDVALIANTGANGTTGAITLATLTLSGGSVSTSTLVLPGSPEIAGVPQPYTITAHYEGDGNFLPSDSAPVSVIVGQEGSKVQILFETFALSGQQTSGNATTAPYGANTLIRMNVTSSSASGGTCSQNTIGQTGCPTGTVTLKDNGNGLDGSPQGSGAFVLNSIGYTEDQSFSLALLSVGSHPLTATYPGDNSFSGSNAADTITITQAIPTMTASAFPTSIASGGAVTLTAVVNTQSLGAAPTGTVQFFNGTTPLSGTVSLIPVAGSITGTTASLTATLSTTLAFVPPANVSPKTPGFPKNLLWIVVCTALLVLLLLMKIPSSKRRSYAYAAALFLVLLTGAIVGCGSSGGGGGGGGHKDTITAKYSGDTNYAASQSAVTVTIQ